MRRRQGLLAVAAVLAGCAGAPDRRTAEAPRAPQPQRNDIALYAMGLLDTRYRWGGRGPASGFDCSGLVSHVYQEAAGLRVLGTSAELGQKVRPVQPDQLQPGDLVFFNTLQRRHSHMGIYIGDGRFVHAPSSKGRVRVERLDSRYFAPRIDGARTLIASS